MESLSLVLASTVIAVVIGIPLGIAMARSDTVASIVRPVLDLMQTMPAFVYLIPAAMFFGLGAVPGTIATVIFAMPPVVRLTNLGIRQVHAEFVEAGLAFGCTSRQLLFKVQLPNAMPSIMAGINQTIMLSLSMVVIASMIGAGGLGNTVLTGIQRLNVGLGFEGGLAVVILAVILDRITQSFGKGGAGFFIIFIAIGATEWLDMARIVRGQTLSLKRQEFVQAAEALGATRRGVITRHIIPNALGPVIVFVTLLVPKAILLESLLSFLGLGVQDPLTSLGLLISEGAQNMRGASWQLIWPAATLTIILFALNFLGDGLRDSLDPKDR